MRSTRFPRVPLCSATRDGARLTESMGTQRVAKPRAWNSFSNTFPASKTPAVLYVPEFMLTILSSKATARSDRVHGNPASCEAKSLELFLEYLSGLQDTGGVVCPGIHVDDSLEQSDGPIGPSPWEPSELRSQELGTLSRIPFRPPRHRRCCMSRNSC